LSSGSHQSTEKDQSAGMILDSHGSTAKDQSLLESYAVSTCNSIRLLSKLLGREYSRALST